MHELLLASYNTHKCVGVDGIFSPDRIIDVIKEIEPDIIALQEIDKRFGNREGLINPYALFEVTGLIYAPIKTSKPSSFGWHGNAIFYKNVHLVSIEQLDLPGVEPRGALFAIFEKNNIYFCLVAAHFGLLRRCRKSQVKTVVHILSRKYNLPTFLLGDLNEWRTNQKSALQGLDNYFNLPAETNPSFPAHYPVLSLDKIYASHSQMMLYSAVHNSKLASQASDHLPVTAMINLDAAPSSAKFNHSSLDLTKF